MSDTDVIQLAMRTMTVAAELAAPILITALVIGFAVSLVQSVTQIQEVTLSFVPKMVGVAIALLVSGNWMMHTIIAFTTNTLSSGYINQLIGR